MIRLLCCALLVCLAAPAAWAQAPEPGLYDRPVLALDPGRHTAPIVRADVDREGRIAVTGSHDRTVRVWSLENGTLLRTIRVPQGPGNVGKIYAVALDPAGELIAAGGWTRGAIGEEQIYLFDASDGTLVHRIERLPDVFFHLAFSPNGHRLAATLGGGLRVYDRDQGWAEVRRDEGYGDGSYGAAFAPDGRLATTSLDDKLRLYAPDGTLLEAVESGHERPFGVAFSPDGSRLAVGFDDSTEVRLFDGESLAPLPGPDTSGIDDGDLSKVTWSADGVTLYAGGRYADGSGIRPVVAWAAGGSGARRELPASLDTIMSLRPLRGGGLPFG